MYSQIITNQLQLFELGPWTGSTFKRQPDGSWNAYSEYTYDSMVYLSTFFNVPVFAGLAQ